MSQLTSRRKEEQTDSILQDPFSRGQRYNNLSSASDWWEYTKSCFKENGKIFSKNSTTQENIPILRLKEDEKENSYERENFRPEIKLMIENLQNELYQLENKQAKCAKLRANIRSWRTKNAPKLSSKYLKDRI